MSGTHVVALTTALIAAAAAGLAIAWLRLRGPRVVTCPETNAPAGVDLDLRYALLTGAVGRPHFRLRDCSRWPEKAGCGQMCLSEIEESPQGCLVRQIVGNWYAEKTCAYCDREIGAVHWHDHRPALQSPAGMLVEWKDVTPEAVPLVLATHRAVCWNCLVAESFRRDYPDVFIDRPPHSTPRMH